MPHYHFQCNDCGRVMDIEMENVEELNEAASKRFEENRRTSSDFYGHCPYLTKNKIKRKKGYHKEEQNYGKVCM